MDTRRPIDAQAFVITVLLCLTWGFQQIAIKLTSADASPLMQIGLRSAVATLLVAWTMRWQGEALFVRDGTGRAGLLAGLLFGLEFVLIGEALRHTTASHLVVFLYAAPIFTALGLHATLPNERLAPPQWAGVAVAFAGIAVAFLFRGPAATPTPDASGIAASAHATTSVFGDVLALLSGAFWGATTVVIRNSSLARASAKRALIYQLACAAVLGIGVALLLGQGGFHATPRALASMAFQSIVVAFASYLAWFWLLRRYLASRLSVFTFLTPIFGVAFGVGLLGEALDPSFVAGAVMVLAGVVMVSGYDWIRRS